MNENVDILLKRQWCGKDKNNSIIFRRGNLSFDDFKRDTNGYIYEGSFEQGGVSGKIYISIDSENFNDIFEINTKTVKIKGDNSEFSIYLRMADQKELPLDKIGSMGCLKYYLHCEGDKLNYEGKKKRKGHCSKNHSKAKKGTYSVVPSSISWAAAHPYQGGGFSPR